MRLTLGSTVFCQRSFMITLTQQTSPHTRNTDSIGGTIHKCLNI